MTGIEVSKRQPPLEHRKNLREEQERKELGKKPGNHGVGIWLEDESLLDVPLKGMQYPHILLARRLDMGEMGSSNSSST